MRRHLARHQAKFKAVMLMIFVTRTLITVLLALGVAQILHAVEQPVLLPSATAPSTNSGAVSVRPAQKVQPVQDLRDVLAQTVQERNALTADRGTLVSRMWFITVYALLITMVAVWFVWRHLVGQPKTRPDTGTDVFDSGPVTTSVTVRKNATITIRNSETQQAEVTGSVTTRRFFGKADVASATEPRVDTVRIERRTATARHQTATATARSEQVPQPQVQQPEKPVTARIERRPPTVRVEQQASDRMSAVDVDVKPGTGRTVRREGFSLIEVMISVAVLATILGAVVSGSYSIRRSQQATTEQTQVRELTDLLAERIMGASWDWIGRDRPNQDTETQIINGVATLVTVTNDYRRGAWSWHRRKKPLSATPLPPLSEDPLAAPENHLQQVGLIKQPTGIRDLKVYVEYYTSDLLNTVFAVAGSEGPFNEWEKQSTAATGADLSYILPEDPASFDLSRERRALVVRLLVSWTSSAGGERQHQLVFARRK